MFKGCEIMVFRCLSCFATAYDDWAPIWLAHINFPPRIFCGGAAMGTEQGKACRVLRRPRRDAHKLNPARRRVTGTSRSRLSCFSRAAPNELSSSFFLYVLLSSLWADHAHTFVRHIQDSATREVSAGLICGNDNEKPK